MDAFLDDKYADIAFNVKGRIFTAHRVILKCYAPDLIELCEDFDTTNPMSIKDVDPDIFHFMLKFVYMKSQSASFMSILSAAGKYGFTSLKSDAEIWHLQFLKLQVENVIRHLLIADANNLPLVKKAAMDYILENEDGVVASETYSQLCESPSLMKEVMTAMAQHIKHLSD